MLALPPTVLSAKKAGTRSLDDLVLMMTDRAETWTIRGIAVWLSIVVRELGPSALENYPVYLTQSPSLFLPAACRRSRDSRIGV